MTSFEKAFVRLISCVRRVIFETDPAVIAARVQMTEKIASETSDQTAFNQVGSR